MTVHLRVHKKEARLEVWRSEGRGYRLADVHPILAWSGDLGPKLREGDRQAPEGFYSVTPDGLNPRSRYHLSFDLGFPNEFDRSRGRTGSHLMVHGGAESVGCYAIGDRASEAVYQLLTEAFAAGQPSVSVHCLPFRPTAPNLAAHRRHRWFEFWRSELAPVAWRFEATRRPAPVTVRDGRYRTAPARLGATEMVRALRGLELAEGDYAVAGPGSQGAHGSDGGGTRLDVLVRAAAWGQVQALAPPSLDPPSGARRVEILDGALRFDRVRRSGGAAERLIDTAQVIDGVPFVRAERRAGGRHPPRRTDGE